MSDKSAIEWTDATWNPIVGCSIVSPACTNCYAMAMAARLERMAGGALNAIAVHEKLRAPTHYAGLTQPSKSGPVWTGKIVQAPDHILTTPLRWKRPRKIFVNSMGDLFHESVPDEWIDRAFAVMALAPQHTFQILTKRSKRMREWFAMARVRSPATRELVYTYLTHVAGYLAGADKFRQIGDQASIAWPLPNVWLGVTAEDQAHADERRADLEALARQGWPTFASYEPALGPVDWNGWEFLRQLIAGGESGPKARPPYPDWFRDARDWSAAAGVAFFFKQWGEWAPGEAIAGDIQGRSERGAWFFAGSWRERMVSVRESESMTFDDEPDVWRVGKRRAGSLLDGREHKAFPQ